MGIRESLPVKFGVYFELIDETEEKKRNLKWAIFEIMFWSEAKNFDLTLWHKKKKVPGAFN